jgi:hypothetical protein
MLLGWPRWVQTLIVTLVGFLVARGLARRARRRLVIYHVDADALDAALRESLGPEPFTPTLDGYEDKERARGVRVERSPRWQTAVVEAFGRDPELLIAQLAPEFRARLRAHPARASGVSLILFSLSALTMVIPLTGYLLASPRTRAALRVLLQHLQGG